MTGSATKPVSKERGAHRGRRLPAVGAVQPEEVERRLAELEEELEEHQRWLREDPLLRRHEKAA